jgi:uncharacterized protein YggE
MKKIICVCLSLLVLFSLSLPALAEQENEKIIRVVGNATVSLAADTAVIQIGVNTRSETVREAQTENAELMKAVMDAIHAVGIEDKDIVTSQFNVYSNYEYSSDSLGREKRTLYYQVQNNVAVTIHDLTLIGTVLDAAMDAGANTTYGIAFSSTKENDAYQKALTRAVEDAMQKANILAAAAGVELGDLVLINASQNTGAFARDAYGISNSFLYEAKAADAGTSITSGDISVSAEVTLEYRFK